VSVYVPGEMSGLNREADHLDLASGKIG